MFFKKNKQTTDIQKINSWMGKTRGCSAKKKESIYLVRKNTIEKKKKNNKKKGRNKKGDRTNKVLQVEK